MSPSQFDAGDPLVFSRLIDAFVEFVGPVWIANAEARASLEELEGSTGSGEGTRLLRAVRAFIANAQDDQAKQDREDPYLRMFFSGVSLTILEGAALRGAELRVKRIRQLLHAQRFEQAFDILFELEAALHWSRGVIGVTVEFPPEDNPEFWVVTQIAGHTARIPIPHQCKRVQPGDPREVALERFADGLEKTIRSESDVRGALKATVWTHVSADRIDAPAVSEGIRTTVARAVLHPGTWLTRSAPDGTWQVSIAHAPEWGEFERRPIQLPDVPALPVIRTAIELTYYGTEQDPSRLKYALSVRSDILPKRIGSFERNLVAAIRQLGASAHAIPGVVNIRLRPPRGLGDLYEAESIVRRVLASPEGRNVAAVCLLWNETEREDRGAVKIDDQTGREVRAMWHLRAHYVSARGRTLDLRALELNNRRLPATKGYLLRDPGSGELVPVPLEALQILDNPLDPEADPADEEPESEVATLYFRTDTPYHLECAQQVAAIRIGGRLFLAAFAPDGLFRVVEFDGKSPVAVASLDLRAWLGATEFHFVINAEGTPWSVVAQRPEGDATTTVLGAPVPRVF